MVAVAAAAMVVAVVAVAVAVAVVTAAAPHPHLIPRHHRTPVCVCLRLWRCVSKSSQGFW